MTGLDTNILARYYIEEPDADAKSLKQRETARQVMQSGKQLFVAKTVILEFEWVCRSVYLLDTAVFIGLLTHLLGVEHIDVEDAASVDAALQWHKQGMAFSDALHLASSSRVREFLTFDKRKFANRAGRLKTTPAVVAA
jgi:predicted nucleic-acid-binding protein